MTKMRLHHLIIGAKDKEQSSNFYSDVLGYRFGSSFRDTGTGEEGVVLLHDSAPEVLVVPFRPERLPSPQHIAFEVDQANFEGILRLCQSKGLRPRAHPPLNSDEGTSEFEQSGLNYRHFYVLDPSGINVEVMCPNWQEFNFKSV